MNLKKLIKPGFSLITFLILAGCSSVYKPSSSSSYSAMNCDESETQFHNPKNLKQEQKSSTGNPVSYEVFGEIYQPFNRLNKGYQEQGLASWYGPNFMGEKTSTGEIFNPCELTAAHRLVPIPSYFLVQNLENNKEIIVRVNDRGPFVKTDDRIIDLSYMAAKKLGFENKGTAKVKITSLSNHKHTNPISAIQAGSFDNKEPARRQKNIIENISEIQDKAVIMFRDGVYRLIIFSEKQRLDEISKILKSYKIDNFLTTIHQ